LRMIAAIPPRFCWWIRGFRSAADFAVIRSLLSTAKKQGWNMLDTLAADPKRLIAELKSA